MDAMLRAFVDAWPAALLLFDPDRRVTYSNAAAREMFSDDLEELSTTQRAERWTFRDDAGRLVGANRAPSARMLRGETVTGEEYQLVYKDGRQRRVRIDGYPLRDEAGAIVGAACLLADTPTAGRTIPHRLFEGISTWLEAAERGRSITGDHAFVAAVGHEMAASLDHETTLDTLIHAVVPRLADWCVIRLVGDDGRLRRLGTAYSHPGLAAVAVDMEDYYAARAAAGSAIRESAGIEAVLRTGQPTFVPRVTEEWLRSVANDERHLELLRRLGTASVMHVPMLVRGRVVGLITFIRTKMTEPYEVRHLAVAEELCDRAAVAIENARLFGESERRRREAQALSEIARLLAETMDPRVVALRIADSVGIFLEDTASAAVYSIESGQDESRAVAISTASGVRFHWTPVLPPGAGVVALAVTQRRTVAASDVLAHPDVKYPPAVRAQLEVSEYRAVMAIPLIAQDRVLGALAVGARSGRRFEPREIELLSTFADQAAVSFNNARLFEESERRGREAERARAAAEAANQSKDDFLAILSHELRTPLTAILGWVRMLERGVLPEARAAEALEAIDRNTRLQARLINDLLDVSRIIAGKLDVERLPVNLADVVRTVVLSARQDPHARELLAEPVIDPGTPPVVGDRLRLEQVISNVVSNAVKYTPRGGRIDVRVLRTNHHIEIVVADTGEGIEPADLPRIFERFHQADVSKTRRHGGLGLGLTIVRHLVEMHGGAVRAESGGRGCGSTFTISLPRADVAAPTTATPAHGEGREHGLPLRGVRALFVDDNEDARTLVRAALQTAGADVALAESADQGLQLIDATPFDVVLSDIGMPDIDGYDFVRRLRERVGGARVPAIALTAYAGTDDRRRVLAAGFQRHIAKPIDPSDLVSIVRNVLDTHAA
jgi:signal transduction histidine kinase